MNTTNQPTTAIAVNGVTKTFGNGANAFTALDNVSVDIQDNEFFTLLGPSGCGKTTLLRLIAGFEHPTDGEILLHGEQIAHLPPYQRSVNTVFQNYALFPHMTVAENIAFGLQMRKQPKAKIKQTVDEMLDLVKMTAMKDRKTNQISGGQQQRVALARALAPHPKVLLLDEPLSALDYKLRKDMQLELKRLQSDTGITFIFVTHDQEEALTMSDRVAVMSAGNILQVAPPHVIYDRPAVRFVADFIGDTNFLNADISKLSANNSDVDNNGDNNNNSGLQIAELNLAAGGQATAVVNASYKNNEKVTVAIRPEQVTLSSNPDEGMLRGKISQIVYFGTDTHYHLTLSGEETFTARVQNTNGREAHFAQGSEVSVIVPPTAVQVLRD